MYIYEVLEAARIDPALQSNEDFNKMKELGYIKDIEGYEGIYCISRYGLIFKYKKDDNRYARELNQQINQQGYRIITLGSPGNHKVFLVHRLVAQAFIPNPNNLPQVNHKDENPLNCYVDNLEWCTQAYNNSYGTREERIKQNKIMSGFYHRIRCVETGEIFESLKAAALSCSPKGSSGVISKQIQGKLHTAYGYHWELLPPLEEE